MRTLAEIFAGRASDKGTVHSYVEVYESLLAPWRAQPGHVLEIGVFGGESIRAWEEYFQQATVWGIDLCDQPLGLADLRPMMCEPGHNIVLGSITEAAVVEQFFSGFRFNVVIDDGSHNLADQLAAYRNLRPLMVSGGLYVIEDIQDLDSCRAVYEALGATADVEILDRRRVKGRYDDVLVVLRIP